MKTNNYFLDELSSDELIVINGGDKFMEDLGHFFGDVVQAIWGFITYNPDVKMSETLMNCI